MKSLRPQQDMKSTVFTKQEVEELKDRINELTDSVASLSESISDIQDEVDTIEGNVTPEYQKVTTVDLEVTRDSTLNDVSADSVTATTMNASDMESTNLTVTNVLDASHINTPDLDAEVGSIDQLQSENISVDVLAADEATIPSLAATTATIGTANIATANIGTYNVAQVDATEVDTPLVKATEAVIDSIASDEAEIEDAVINTLEAEDLWNRNRWFQDDTRRIQITDVAEDTPGYICIDTKGVQTAKIRASDDGGELFTVIFSNARSVPMVQWSKRTDFTLNKFFYGFKTNKLYLQVWQDCSIQWQIDAFEDTPHAPSTYSELPENLIDCYRYNVGRKNGIVLMGDGEESTVLSVQGTIEGNFLVDSGEFTYVNFYSDSAYDLFKVAKAFFRTGSDEDGWRYEKAEVFGYLRHTDTIAPAYEPYTFTSSSEAYVGLNSMSGPRTSADTTFVDTDPLVNSVDCVYVTGGSTQLYTTVNGEYKKILKICTTSDVSADYLWPIVWVEGDDTTSLAGASIRLLEPRTGTGIPSLLSISYYTATGASHSPYRDEDNTEIEALEKVEYVDENTILLTINNKYGQDEITITVTPPVGEDEKLPFVLGFTFRTPKVDTVFNEDAEPYPGAKDQVHFYGD